MVRPGREGGREGGERGEEGRGEGGEEREGRRGRGEREGRRGRGGEGGEGRARGMALLFLLALVFVWSYVYAIVCSIERSQFDGLFHQRFVTSPMTR